MIYEYEYSKASRYAEGRLEVGYDVLEGTDQLFPYRANAGRVFLNGVAVHTFRCGHKTHEEVVEFAETNAKREIALLYVFNTMWAGKWKELVEAKGYTLYVISDQIWVDNDADCAYSIVMSHDTCEKSIEVLKNVVLFNAFRNLYPLESD